jgi:tetratricopeptide (TPR) repeat protein
MKHFQKTSASLVLILLFAALAPPAFPQVPEEPRLIRDTDVAEGKNDSAVKEPNPALAAQNVNIGNYYLKQKNYSAAIQRFNEAIEYQADLIPAYEGLAQAYEKNGQILKAVETYKGFLEKYPDSPKVRQFRSRLAKLESKTK